MTTRSNDAQVNAHRNMQVRISVGREISTSLQRRRVPTGLIAAVQVAYVAVMVGVLVWMVVRNDLGWPWWAWTLLLTLSAVAAWFGMLGLVVLVNRPDTADTAMTEYACASCGYGWEMPNAAARVAPLRCATCTAGNVPTALLVGSHQAAAYLSARGWPMTTSHFTVARKKHRKVRGGIPGERMVTDVAGRRAPAWMPADLLAWQRGRPGGSAS